MTFSSRVSCRLPTPVSSSGKGPIFQLPTNTSTNLGSNLWSVGPSVVGFTMHGPWMVGLLVQNLWSFAGPGGNDNPSVNQFLAQYFVNYNLPHGWYITSSLIITADWKAAGSQQWMVLFGGGFGNVHALRVAFYSLPAYRVRPLCGPFFLRDGTIER